MQILINKVDTLEVNKCRIDIDGKQYVKINNKTYLLQPAADITLENAES